MEYPTFNQEYEILRQLGEGDTSKVYLCRHIQYPNVQVALKILKRTFLERDEHSIRSVEQEIQVLYGLDHSNIIKMHGYGTEGVIIKPSGKVISKIVYIILEYVPGGLFFDLCQTAGGMGEQGGRYFMEQLKDVLVYLSAKRVAHRDLKLENIMVDDNLQLKIADFGFATYKKIDKLKSYRGTKTYMPPEIKEYKTYDGLKADMFSVGVILFIIVQGIFPFSEAKPDEYFYKLLIDGELETYWEKTGAQNLSAEFKDLISKMLSYNPANRPTVEELVNHPWMKSTLDYKKSRELINNALSEDKYDSITT